MAARGKMKRFSESKGYGFIEKEDGGDVFEHFSGIISAGCEKFGRREDATFDSFTDPKGPNAPHVVKLVMAPLEMLESEI